MKLGSKISILLLAICQYGWAQGFTNLNFESAIIQTNLGTTFYVDPSKAIPGWTAYLNGNPQSVIDYDSFSLGGAMASLQDTNAVSYGAIQGNYSVLLLGATVSGGGGNPLNASIGQTGTIPITAQSLSFWGSQYNGTLQVTFDGQRLTIMDISNALNYTIWGADISAYAGQTGQLLFTAVANIPFASGGLLDNVQFSTLPVPEPTEFALGVLGVLTLGFHFTRSRPG